MTEQCQCLPTEKALRLLISCATPHGYFLETKGSQLCEMCVPRKLPLDQVALEIFLTVYMDITSLHTQFCDSRSALLISSMQA